MLPLGGSAELKLVPLDALKYPVPHDSLAGERMVSIPLPDDVVEPDLFFLYLVGELLLWTRAEAVGLQIFYGVLAACFPLIRGQVVAEYTVACAGCWTVAVYL